LGFCRQYTCSMAGPAIWHRSSRDRPRTTIRKVGIEESRCVENGDRRLGKMLNTAFETCPERLSAAHGEQFQRDGYLAFIDVLTPEEVQHARDALSELICRTVGQTREEQSTFRRLPDSRCYVQFEPGYVPEEGEYADIK